VRTDGMAGSISRLLKKRANRFEKRGYKEAKKRRLVQCQKCGYAWHPKIDNAKRCPSCFIRNIKTEKRII